MENSKANREKTKTIPNDIEEQAKQEREKKCDD